MLCYCISVFTMELQKRMGAAGLNIKALAADPGMLPVQTKLIFCLDFQILLFGNLFY